MAQTPASALNMRPPIGTLKHLIELQEAVKVIDEINGFVTTQWPVFGHDWAAFLVQPVVFSELEATVLYQVLLRYRADIVEKFDNKKTIRVVGGGRTVKVLAIQDTDLLHQDLVLFCGRITE